MRTFATGGRKRGAAARCREERRAKARELLQILGVCLFLALVFLLGAEFAWALGAAG